MKYEDVVNRAFVIKYAEIVKEYCNTHKNCKECVFYIGTCQLNQHPCNWDLKRIDYGLDRINENN